MSLSTLNDECLREILLHLPILDRIKIRRVCKKWRTISDDCWRAVRHLYVNEPEWSAKERRHERDTAVGDSRRIELKARNEAFVLGFVKRCAPYLSSFITVELLGRHAIPQPLETCCTLKKLHIQVHTRKEHEILKKLLLLNQEIKNFRVLLEEGIYLQYLTTDHLEDLSILLTLRSLTTPITAADAAVLKEVIQRCQLLKRLCLDQLPDFESLEIIGEKRTLEYLTLNDRYDYTLSDKFNNILKLSHLRGLSICSIGTENLGINDDFIGKLTSYCINLEIVKFVGCAEVTDEGLQALTTLPKLKALSLQKANKVTDKYLTYCSKLETLEISFADVEDSGVCALLRSSPQLQQLMLICTRVTKKVVRVAIEEVRKRENHIPLKLFFGMDDNKIVGDLKYSFPPLLRLERFELKV